MTGPLADPRAEAVLRRLHAEDRRQFGAILRHYLPRVIMALLTRKTGLDAAAPEHAAFLRDKLVALDAEKGRLAYMLCRALDARRVVEIGTSFGVSTIYLAAALRDNAGGSLEPRRVIGTELEPTKIAQAQANLAEAGLDGFAEIRLGDALVTLADLAGPIDFLLIDTWIPLALPALKLLTPLLRQGAVVMCDNVKQFAKDYQAYTDFIRNPGNGFRSMLWPNRGGVEISVRHDAD